MGRETERNGERDRREREREREREGGSERAAATRQITTKEQ